MTYPPVPNLLTALHADFGHPSFLWQIGVLALSLLIGWQIGAALKHRHPPTDMRRTGFHRVVFPLAALLCLIVGRAVLKHWFHDHVHLLNLAVPLLVALILTHLTFHMMRRVFAPSGWLHIGERVIALLIWAGLAMHITGLLPAILQSLDDIPIDYSRGQHISLLSVLSAIASVAISLVAALWLGREAEKRLMQAYSIDMSLRVMLAKLTHALLVFIGLIIALAAAGINLTLLSLIGGALGVGLGFGLQKIASNYVSGFIILLDHSIRIGDLIAIDNRYGVITRLTGRYVVLKSTDGSDTLIPNETLITSTVINYHYSGREARLALPVQISYASDLDRAMQILQHAAACQPRVLKTPPPQANITGFGDNGVNLEVLAWISDPEREQRDLRSAIYYRIWQDFRRDGIDIPYPQREVRMIGQPGDVTILGEQPYASPEEEVSR